MNKNYHLIDEIYQQTNSMFKNILFRLFYLILQPLLCKKVQSTRIITSKNEAI